MHAAEGAARQTWTAGARAGRTGPLPREEDSNQGPAPVPPWEAPVAPSLGGLRSPALGGLPQNPPCPAPAVDGEQEAAGGGRGFQSRLAKFKSGEDLGAGHTGGGETGRLLAKWSGLHVETELAPQPRCGPGASGPVWEQASGLVGVESCVPVRGGEGGPAWHSHTPVEC